MLVRPAESEGDGERDEGLDDPGGASPAGARPPGKGKAWRPVSWPRRLRATYTRTKGVMHVLAALDLATGKLFYRIRHRKRHREFLGLLQALRDRWPGERLHVICDNFSPHRHPTVTTWATDNQVELVFLPTCGSWLNWIEAEFAALRYFAIRTWTHYPAKVA
ncbi:transposase [Kibdelosporangium phytohabitans]|uniref:transposase n=1 Tax=Kibdelosporangium phytohabitans TaxID=860235 RepID=UPI0019EA4AED|nr:transposase [Kibdelosporangium phytohabitans]MBE1463740.1 transposase [Kibdelosporangium phytohabitans]